MPYHYGKVKRKKAKVGIKIKKKKMGKRKCKNVGNLINELS